MADEVFKDVDDARDSITKRQKREIRKYYNQWAREIKANALQYSKMGPEYVGYSRELTQLYYQLRQSSKVLTAEINSTIRTGMSDLSDVAVRTNKRWLRSLGFTESSIDTKFSHSKDIAIRNIISGNLYQNGFSLSTRIWDIENNTMKDIYAVVAKGIAEKKSVYQISLELEKYVKPDARLPWYTTSVEIIGGNKRPVIIHNRQVDYNAQRLARTLLQHCYQQSLVELTKDNPFVKGYLWHASGGHACELCQSRDSNIYTPEDLPLDHPNGQCTIEVLVDEEKIKSDIEGFMDNPILYPDIQRFGLELEL